MSLRKSWKLGAVAVSCAAVGAGASVIANAGASTSSAGPAHAATRAGHARRALLRRAVHGEVVLATKSGFATVIFDRGTVKSVAGRQLTLTEGTKKQTYKTVTLTIPSNARVRDNRQPATLSSVKAGQRVAVITAPKRTLVIARDAVH